MPSSIHNDSANTPQSLTVLLTGGGTGGHITPILAVAHEVKKLRPDARVIYVGERKGKFADLTEGNQDIDEVFTIFAGKFRRYHGVSWWQRLLDFRTIFLNLRDLVLIGLGFVQSLRLLGKIRPNIILLKGGFVGMPVGLAAALRRQSFVTHDSDALPGLANRLVSRWARWHATGLPAEHYRYPKESVRHVGVLVVKDYQPVTPVAQKQFKIDLSIQPSMKVLLVTGGSLGARTINLAMVKAAPKLLQQYADLYIIHQVGKGNASTYGNFTHPRLQVLEFLKPMYQYTGAADVVITRAGANTLAEFGVQGKACVVVPNPLLTGGHQLKNAEYLLQQQAIKIVDERALQSGSEPIEEAVGELLSDSKLRRELGDKLKSLTIPDAAARLALLLVEAANTP